MAPMTGTVIKDWNAEMVPLSDLKLDGKSVLVVGGTSGIGQALATQCQASGAKVTVVGRSFKDDPTKISFVKADLSLMSEAKKVGETLEPADVVVLTTGIIAAATRQESPEGLELDLAVSFLSRLVLLKYLAPRLQPKARVFVMGFPGSNMGVEHLEDDWNAEKNYAGGFGYSHMNTVGGNEALVVDSAAKSTNGVLYFGLNPGMIKSGIRSNMYTGVMRVFGPVIEGMLGLFSQSTQSYAKKIVPLLFSPSLDDHNGSMFNPKAQPVEASEYLTKDPTMPGKIITISEELVKTKAGIALP